MQQRRKRRGGKWNKYSSRVKRDVVFFGVDRVVPHSEKSVSRSYRYSFRKVTSKEGWEGDVRQIVGHILGQTYEAFWYKRHSHYRLPVVTVKGNTYTGFNMGAGENALFDIFSTIYTAPDGTLFVIDEIELGLHEEAQAKLVQELKEFCRKRFIQVICTTHSAKILECLPPEGRIFLERFGNETRSITGITPDLAIGKLSGKHVVELDVYVEDNVAEGLVVAAVPNSIRQRINIIPFGSPAAILRHMAGRYKDKGRCDACVILDGDQRTRNKANVNTFMNALESPQAKQAARDWIIDRLDFLPGDKWPEQWTLSVDPNSFKKLAAEFGVAMGELEHYLENALQAEKHSEFWNFAQKLNVDAALVRARFAKCAMEASSAEAQRIERFLQQFLS